MLRNCCVALSIFASAIIASARADEFPIKKFGPFTYVVDYEASWSPDSRQIVLVSSRHGGVPGFRLVSASDLGQNAFIGTVTQGDETHIGLGALQGTLIVGTTLVGDPTPDNIANSCH